MKKLNLITLISLFSFSVYSQKMNAGLEYQYYPAGHVPSLRAEYFTSSNYSLLVNLGLNITDRKDYSSKNDTEVGKGWGFGLGMNRYTNWLEKQKIYFGARIYLWQLAIDWTNKTTIPPKGKTDVLVLQPTAHVGIAIPMKQKFKWHLFLAQGYEYNAKTKGQEVEGSWITLGGLSLNYIF